MKNLTEVQYNTVKKLLESNSIEEIALHYPFYNLMTIKYVSISDSYIEYKQSLEFSKKVMKNKVHPHATLERILRKIDNIEKMVKELVGTR